MNFFKELNSSTAFPICYNLLPHFTAAEQQLTGLLNFVGEALEDGRVRQGSVHKDGIPTGCQRPELVFVGNRPRIAFAK